MHGQCSGVKVVHSLSLLLAVVVVAAAVRVSKVSDRKERKGKERERGERLLSPKTLWPPSCKGKSVPLFSAGSLGQLKEL